MQNETPRSASFRMAFCGVMAALMLVLMLLGTLIPLSAYICPGLAGLFLLPVLWEFGPRSSAVLFIAVSILSLLLCPNKESAFFFVLLLGWYPILRGRLQHITLRPLRVLVKFLLFNGATALIYALLLFVFVSPELQTESASWTPFLLAAFLVLGNLTFLVYDLLLSHLGDWYATRLRPKLFPRRIP